VAEELLLNRRLIPILGGLLMLAATSSGASAADKPRQDTFVATASTGVGAPLPVDINPSDIAIRADGAIGLGYLYKASGKAVGQAEGTVDYVEHGHLYFFNPADPTTFAGSSFESGVFTIHTRDHGTQVDVSVADTNPQAYQQGVQTTHIGHSAALKLAESRLHIKVADGDVTYGYFTFIDQYGTFTGYASTDFRQFAITIKF